MPNTCVLFVENLLTTGRKTCSQVSPSFVEVTAAANASCEQPQVFPILTRLFPPSLSTRKNPFSPLIEQKFYPVSTAPIISITN